MSWLFLTLGPEERARRVQAARERIAKAEQRRRDDKAARARKAELKRQRSKKGWNRD